MPTTPSVRFTTPPVWATNLMPCVALLVICELKIVTLATPSSLAWTSIPAPVGSRLKLMLLSAKALVVPAPDALMIRPAPLIVCASPIVPRICRLSLIVGSAPKVMLKTSPFEIRRRSGSRPLRCWPRPFGSPHAVTSDRRWRRRRRRSYRRNRSSTAFGSPGVRRPARRPVDSGWRSAPGASPCDRTDADNASDSQTTSTNCCEASCQPIVS